MTTQQHAPSLSELPPPFALFQLATGHYVSHAIYVAATIRVADALADGARSCTELATAKASPDGSAIPVADANDCAARCSCRSMDDSADLGCPAASRASASGMREGGVSAVTDSVTRRHPRRRAGACSARHRY